MLSHLKRNFRLILLALLAIAGGVYLYTAFLASNASGPANRTQASPLDQDDDVDYSAGRALESRFIASLNFSLREIPTTVNFSLSDIDPIPRFSEPQRDKIYVYDIQWIPTQASIVLFVSEKMVPESRPANIGAALTISTFFPNVTLTAISDGRLPILHETVRCYDMQKKERGSWIGAPDTQLTSILYCPTSANFTESFGQRQKNSLAFSYAKLYARFRRLDVVIPTTTLTASKYFGKISRRDPPLVTEPKSMMSVCISSGFHKTIPYAREVAQYYLTLGVDHVYFAYLGDMIHTGSESVAYLMKLLNETRQLEDFLEDFIADGKVSVIFAPGTHNEADPLLIDVYGKLPYLQSCLWHSKAYDNFTAVMDIDELIIVNDTSHMNIKQALMRYFEATPFNEQPTCAMGLTPFSVCEREAGVKSSLLGHLFQHREPLTERLLSPKSIALTQRVKSVGLHYHGTCQALLPMEVLDAANGGRWSCIMLFDLGNPERNLSKIPYNFFYLHFLALHDRLNPSCHATSDQSEYLIWFGEVLNQLLNRCRARSFSSDNSLIRQHCAEILADKNPLNYTYPPSDDMGAGEWASPTVLVVLAAGSKVLVCAIAVWWKRRRKASISISKENELITIFNRENET